VDIQHAINNFPLFKALPQNPVLTAVIGAIAGALLTKLFPAIWAGLKKLLLRCMSGAGGQLALRSFEKRYLNWMVIEHRDLRLTGIVTAEEAKRPLLEQVFISLSLSSSRTSIAQETGPYIPSSVFSVREFRRLVKLESKLLRTQDKGRVMRVPFFHRALRELSALEPIAKAIISLNTSGWIGSKGELRTHLEDWYSRWNYAIRHAIDHSQLRYILQENQRVAILGGPGAGKSTLLQYIALILAQHRVGDKKLKDGTRKFKESAFDHWRVPIFIRLSTLATVLSEQRRIGESQPLVDILPKLTYPDLEKDKAASRYFQKCVLKGRAIFLLDGLDEVPTEQDFQAVLRVIEGTLIHYPDNHFVITSRVAGWRGGIKGDFSVFGVDDLSNDQIARFLHSWYSAVEQNAVIGPLSKEGHTERIARELRSHRRADDLLQTLEANVGIRRIASNPMLLSIIALVHRSLTTLPRERSKLYYKCSEILLEQWDISRGIRVDDTNLRLEQKEAIMMRLAVAFHKGEIGENGGSREARRQAVVSTVASLLPTLNRDPEDADYLLQRLIDRSGLLIERSRGILAFSHHTFQEYFTARYLAQHETEDFLLAADRLKSDWWREVVLLYSGLIPDASKFISSIRCPASEDDLCMRRLRLAAACSEEAVQVRNPEIRLEIIGNICEVREFGGKLDHALEERKEVASYLIGWSKSPEWFVSASLASARRNNSQEDIFWERKLQAALGDSDRLVREAAISCIRDLDVVTPEIRGTAIKLVEDEDVNVARLAAVLTVETLDGSESERLLYKLGELFEKMDREDLREIFNGLTESQAAQLTGDLRRFHATSRQDAKKAEPEVAVEQALIAVKGALEIARRRKPQPLHLFRSLLHPFIEELSRFIPMSSFSEFRSTEERALTSLMAAVGGAGDSRLASEIVLECIAGLGAINLSVRLEAVEVLIAFFHGQSASGGPKLSEISQILGRAGRFEGSLIWAGLARLKDGIEVSGQDFQWWHRLAHARSPTMRLLALRSVKRADFLSGDIPSEVWAILGRGIKSINVYLRIAAVEASGALLRGEQAINGLSIIEQGFRDRNVRVRVAAIQACVLAWSSLSEVTRGVALRTAVEICRQTKFTPRAAHIWLRALETLSAIGQRFSAPEVFAAIKDIARKSDMPPLYRDHSAPLDYLRVELLKVGRSLSDANLVEEIRQLLAGSTLEQVLGLGLIRDGALVASLEATLETVAVLSRDSSSKVRYSAIEATKACARPGGSVRSADLMVRALVDEEEEIREVSWIGLRNLDLLGSAHASPRPSKRQFRVALRPKRLGRQPHPQHQDP
jgi:energy-coupling factor transporter ATP-binding protein EcfA2